MSEKVETSSNDKQAWKGRIDRIHITGAYIATIRTFYSKLQIQLANTTIKVNIERFTLW